MTSAALDNPFKGYAATSIRDLADAIGVQKSALYHYVVSKEDLLFRISTETLEQSLTEMREIIDSPVSSVEQLRRAIDHHVQYVAVRGTATTVFLRDIGALEGVRRDEILQLAREYRSIWHRIVERGIERGEFRPVDVRMTVMAIIGAGNWVATWFASGGRLTSDDVATIFFDLFLTGLIGGPASNTTSTDFTQTDVAMAQSKLIVRWGDVDGSGTVPIAQLLRWCEDATDALLESKGADLTYESRELRCEVSVPLPEQLRRLGQPTEVKS